MIRIRMIRKLRGIPPGHGPRLPDGTNHEDAIPRNINLRHTLENCSREWRLDKLTQSLRAGRIAILPPHRLANTHTWIVTPRCTSQAARIP